MPVTRDKLIEYFKSHSFEQKERVKGYRAKLYLTSINIINDEVESLESAILIKDRVNNHCERLGDFLHENS